jgi:crossover junction endodeoxyribonuclease RuvC
MIHIFGIDPGTAVTGYGVIRIKNNTVSWVDSGIIDTKKTDTLADKLSVIYEKLNEKIRTYTPELVSIEQAFYAKNVRTTLILGHARGVALLAACQSGAVIEEYSPREIKKAVVGNGNAAKTQIEFMVKTLLSPPKEHCFSDAYDALAAALCSFYHQTGKQIGTARTARRPSRRRPSFSRH